MTDAELLGKLTELCALSAETEWVEFKHNNSNPEEIGEYLSALSNAAALHGRPAGYIVWGIENGTHRLLGTTFRPRTQKGAGNEDLEPWLTRLLFPRIDFRIHDFSSDGHRVVLFEVQAANTTPVRFKEVEWVRVGSHRMKLREHPEKARKLWRPLSGPVPDWSAQPCPDATAADLDPKAVAFAREQYKRKHPSLAREVDGWPGTTFLNKAKVAVGGRLTRSAILLLGREESAYFLSPAVAQMSWILKDSAGVEKDYAHFGPPFIRNVDEVYKKVRNLTVRVPGGGTLYPDEISKYDDWVVREALHNCIAHQDYSQGGRIQLVEEDDSLLFTNRGHFIPESVERVIERDAPEEQYRNLFLVQAMVELNMIDTIGSGIKRMFHRQKARFLPMPDYDLSDPQRVKVRIFGKILDERFTRLLIGRTDLPLEDVIALDKVQKGRPIADEVFRALKRRGLIEGRKVAPYLSAAVAEVTGQEADYLRRKGFDKADCKRKVLDHLRQFGGAVRGKLEEILFPVLSSGLTDAQKQNFVKNLIQDMKREGLIRKSRGARSDAVWVLSNPTPDEPN